MIHPRICPQCQQPNDQKSVYCWKCSRSFARSPTTADYERLFTLQPSWSTADLKKAYHAKAMECHPDKHPNDREADARFQFINEAYEALSLQPRRGGSRPKASRGKASDSPGAPAHDHPVGQTSLDDLADALFNFYKSRYGLEDPMDYWEQRSRRLLIAAIFIPLAALILGRWLIHLSSQ